MSFLIWNRASRTIVPQLQVTDKPNIVLVDIDGIAGHLRLLISLGAVAENIKELVRGLEITHFSWLVPF